MFAGATMINKYHGPTVVIGISTAYPVNAEIQAVGANPRHLYHLHYFDIVIHLLSSPTIMAA